LPVLCKFADIATLLAAFGICAQTSAPVPVFTEEQAGTGRLLYRTQQPGIRQGLACIDCHLEGRTGKGGKPTVPPLAGSDFQSKRGPRTTTELYRRIQLAEPLKDGEYLALVAYILQVNGAKAGSWALTKASAVSIGEAAR
jgi:cytochrome c553